MNLPTEALNKGVVRYHSENIKAPKLLKKATTNWIISTAERYGKEVGEINYIFCDDIRILEINREFLRHDYFTDVITFDYTEENLISGDIYISVDTVKSNAQEYGVSFSQELHRVIIHGVLHLCGFDDKTPEEQQEMRRKEDIAISMI